MDEPLSNLDAKLRVSMRAHIKHLHHELGVTTLYVTHDQIEAMTLADRVVVMSKAEIQQIGTPEAIYNDPANLFVAGFIGAPAMNLVAGALTNGVFSAAGENFKVRVAGFANLNKADVVLGVRAEDISVVPDSAKLITPHLAGQSDGQGNGQSDGRHDEQINQHMNGNVSGQVFSFELLGDATTVTLKLGSQFMTAKAEKNFRANIGDEIGFALKTERCYLFDSQTQDRMRFESA